MAPRPYERVSAFREATTIDAGDDQPAQTSFLPTTSNFYPHYPEFNYKPFILRHPALLTLLLVAGALIGLLEYAVIELPHSSTGLTTRSVKARRTGGDALHALEYRQESSQSTSSQSTTVVENTLVSAYVQTSSSAAVTYHTAAVSAYVPTTGSITVSQSSQVTPHTLAQTQSDYVVTKPSSTIITGTTPQSAYVSANIVTASGNAAPSSLADKRKGAVVYWAWDTESTFQGTYLAILVAVVYRMLWMMVYNSFNLVDPFLQLMQPGGATAAAAFFSFYQSQSNLLGPIPAMLRKRSMLAFVATVYAIVGTLPAFASESIIVDTNWGCPNPNLKHKHNPCHPRISVNVTITRVLQGVLAFTAAALAGISVYLAFKKTGLRSDPRSIAAIGSLMQHPVLIDDLNGTPVGSTRDEMQQSLGDKTYTLGSYKSGQQEPIYGIKPIVEDIWPSQSSKIRSFNYAPVGGYSEPKNRTQSSPSRFRIVDLLLLFATLGAFGVVLAYYLDSNSDGFNNFFNSNTFGPRFVVTLAGTIIASMWKSVEQAAIIMAPFLRMEKKPSSPKETILFAPSTTPISSTWRSFRNGYIMVGVITLITLLAEALNITISGVPFASGQTWQQFIVSTYISIAILGIMILTLTVIIISRFGEPRIPRKPDTLGPMMSYLAGSCMLHDLAETEKLDVRIRDRLIRQADKSYEFKEAIRIDGKIAWKVDETSKHDSYYTL